MQLGFSRQNGFTMFVNMETIGCPQTARLQQSEACSTLHGCVSFLSPGTRLVKGSDAALMLLLSTAQSADGNRCFCKCKLLAQWCFYGDCRYREWTPRLLISSPERRGVFSRAAFIMYIPVNCQNSGRGPGSRSVGMLRGIVKNLQLKCCVERLLLLYSSHLSHHAFARGHTGASGHARIDSLPHPLKVLWKTRRLFKGGYYFPSLTVKHGVNLRAATKRGVASIRINTVYTYIFTGRKWANTEMCAMFRCI